MEIVNTGQVTNLYRIGNNKSRQLLELETRLDLLDKLDS